MDFFSRHLTCSGKIGQGDGPSECHLPHFAVTNLQPEMAWPQIYLPFRSKEESAEMVTGFFRPGIRLFRDVRTPEMRLW